MKRALFSLRDAGDSPRRAVSLALALTAVTWPCSVTAQYAASRCGAPAAGVTVATKRSPWCATATSIAAAGRVGVDTVARDQSVRSRPSTTTCGV